LHKKYSDLLQKYIDQEISPSEKVILEEHLLSCRMCRRELDQLKLLDWELKHEQSVEIPAELFVYRMAAIKTHLHEAETSEKKFMIKDMVTLQLQIISRSYSFLGYNPVNRTLNHTLKRSLKRSLAFLGKTAAVTLKKRNPLLDRIIPGWI